MPSKTNSDLSSADPESPAQPPEERKYLSDKEYLHPTQEYTVMLKNVVYDENDWKQFQEEMEVGDCVEGPIDFLNHETQERWEEYVYLRGFEQIRSSEIISTILGWVQVYDEHGENANIDGSSQCTILAETLIREAPIELLCDNRHAIIRDILGVISYSWSVPEKQSAEFAKKLLCILLFERNGFDDGFMADLLNDSLHDLVQTFPLDFLGHISEVVQKFGHLLNRNTYAKLFETLLNGKQYDYSEFLLLGLAKRAKWTWETPVGCAKCKQLARWREQQYPKGFYAKEIPEYGFDEGDWELTAEEDGLNFAEREVSHNRACEHHLTDPNLFRATAECLEKALENPRKNLSRSIVEKAIDTLEPLLEEDDSADGDSDNLNNKSTVQEAIETLEEDENEESAGGDGDNLSDETSENDEDESDSDDIGSTRALVQTVFDELQQARDSNELED